MKRSRSIVTLLGVALAGLLCVGADPADNAPKPDKDGFVSLFDGKSLDGWKVGDNAKSWSVEDGHLTVHGPGPAHLFYDGPIHNHDWKNFHLKAEVMTFPHANSGIYFHTKFQESSWPAQGFECQVNATHSDPIKTGSLYHVKDIPDPHHKDNEWFVYEIIVKDSQVTLKINGDTVNEWTQPEGYKGKPAEPGRFLQHGTVALQGHDPNSQVYFKSVLIKALD